MGNEWAKRKREEYKSKGICIQCHENKAKKDRTKCSKCAEMSSKAGGIPTINYDIPKIREDITGRTVNNWYIIGYSHNIRYIVKNKSNAGANHFWKVKCTNCDHESTKTKSYILSTSSCSICHLKQSGRTGLNSLYAAYRCGADDRGLKFNITKEEFEKITSSSCFYCGTLPSRTTNWGHLNKERFEWGTYKFNGIDRKDNSLGYEDGNCLPCCKTCNLAKNNLPFDEFIKYLDNLVSYRNNLSVDRVVTSNFDFEEEEEEAENLD